MDQNTSVQDTELDEELNLDLEEEQGDTSQVANGDVEALTKRLADVEAMNKKLYARIKRQPAEKPKLTQKPDEDSDDLRKTVAQLQMAEKKRQFGYDNGLSPEETDKIFKINSNPSKETLEDEFVKAGLDAMRAKQRVNAAIPSTSSRATAFKGKSFAQMDENERKEFFANR